MRNFKPIKAKQNVKKQDYNSLGTVPSKKLSESSLIEDMITNKIICRDPEQEKRIARIKETKAEHERKRKVMQVRFLSLRSSSGYSVRLSVNL